MSTRFFSQRTLTIITTVWLLLWYVIGRFDLKTFAQSIAYTGVMAALVLLFLVGARLGRRPLPHLGVVISQMALILGASYILHDILLAMALFFLLLGGQYLTAGITRFTVWVSIAAAISLFALQVTFEGILSLFVVSAIFFAPAPIVAGVAVAFIERGREQQATQARLHAIEIAHLEDLILTRERQRLARDLHDTLAQGVVGVILQLEAATNYLEHDQVNRASTIIQGTMQRARTTLHEARQAITDLRMEESLPQRISAEAERFSAATDVPCTVTLTDLSEEDPLVAEVVMRAIAEGLINIARHAHATHAHVRVSATAERVEVLVRDDGIGFDQHQRVPPGHFGLQGIAERLHLLGGQLTITSGAGTGTALTMTIPKTPEGTR